MGSRLSPNPMCCQLRTLFSPRRNVIDKNNAMPYRLAYGSAFFGSRNLRVQTVKCACSADFDDFHHEETMNLIQEGAGKLDLPKNPENTQNRKVKNVSVTGFDFLEPSLLGIQPEPPSWPERDRILRLNFERNVNSVEIPFSIQMIKKKLQLQKGFKEAGELSHCSVKKTFSSMLVHLDFFCYPHTPLKNLKCSNGEEVMKERGKIVISCEKNLSKITRVSS